MMVKVFDMFEDGQSAGEVPMPAMTYRLETFGQVAERPDLTDPNYRERGVKEYARKLLPSPKKMDYTLCDDHSHYFVCEQADGLLRHAELVESKLCDKSCGRPKFFEGIDTDLHISDRASAVFRKERRRLMPARIKASIKTLLDAWAIGNAY